MLGLPFGRGLASSIPPNQVLTWDGVGRISGAPVWGAGRGAGWVVLFEIVELEEGMRGRRLRGRWFAQDANVLAAFDADLSVTDLGMNLRV